jgi:hypothetical protein
LEKLIDKDPEGGWFKTRGKFVKAISTHAGKGVFSDPFIMSGLQFLTDMGILERKGESKHFWRFYPGVQSAGYLKAYDEPMPWYNNLSMVDVHADPDQERIFNLTQASAATLRQMRRALAAQEKDHKKLLESSRRIKTAFDERKSALSDIGLS